MFEPTWTGPNFDFGKFCMCESFEMGGSFEKKNPKWGLKIQLGFILVCWSVTVTDILRQCQPDNLIPLLPWPGFDPSFSGHNDE